MLQGIVPHTEAQTRDRQQSACEQTSLLRQIPADMPLMSIDETLANLPGIPFVTLLQLVDDDLIL